MVDLIPESTSTKSAPVMLVSAQLDHWITSIAADRFDYFAVPTAAEAVRALHNLRYDLIVVDDMSFQKDVPRIVQELKRRNPTVPLIVIVETLDTDRQDMLFKAGADDFLTQSMSPNEIEHHLRLMLKQHLQNRALAQRTHNRLPRSPGCFTTPRTITT